VHCTLWGAKLMGLFLDICDYFFKEFLVAFHCHCKSFVMLSEITGLCGHSGLSAVFVLLLFISFISRSVLLD